MDDQKKQVTPLATVAAGAAALAVGGLAGGMSHYHGTRKQLIEEGIDPRARLRALPIAAKALGISLAVTVALGLAGVAAWNLAGLESKQVAEVSGFLDAVAQAKQQRDAVRKELRSRIFHESPDGGGSINPKDRSQVQQ